MVRLLLARTGPTGFGRPVTSVGLLHGQWGAMAEMSAGKSMNVFLCIGEASARAAVLLEAMGHVLGRGNRKICGQPHW